VPPREREALFHEAQKERDARERGARRAARDASAAALRTLLEADAGVVVGSEWRVVSKRLAGEDAFEALTEVERMDVFQAYLRDLQREQEEARERAKEERKARERAAREGLKAAFAAHRGKGLLRPRTTWAEYSPHVQDNEHYEAVENAKAGLRPKELFALYMEDVAADYTAAKASLRALCKAGGVEVAAEGADFGEFCERLAEAERKLQAAAWDAAGAGTGGAGAAASEEGGSADGDTKSSAAASKDAAAPAPAALLPPPPALQLASIEEGFKLAFFEEQVERAVAAAADAAREAARLARIKEREDKAAERFRSLLRHAHGIRHDTSWQEFRTAFDREPEYREVWRCESGARRVHLNHILDVATCCGRELDAPQGGVGL